MSRDWIDISVPLREGMVGWPGDPPLGFERIAAIERGAALNLSAVSMSLHAGTHVDAPVHYLEGGEGVERMPFDAMVGPARVIEIRGPNAIRLVDIQSRRIRRGERILFKTANSPRTWRAPEFVEDYVCLTRDAAEYLVERGVRTAGIDYLSIGPPDQEGDAVHRLLLRAGVWIIEGLNLTAVQPGNYDLVCLPLNVPGGDGAPARAILRQRRR